VFSLVGLVLGAWLGRVLLDVINGASTSTSISRTTISAAILFAGITLGSTIGGFLGKRLRNVISWSPIRLLDNLTGATLSFVAWSVVLWLMATTLLAAPVSSLTNTVSQSKVLNALEQYMPNEIRSGVDLVRVYVSSSGLPDEFANVLLSPTVDPPDLTSIDAPAVIAALDSVVKVEGTAPECSTRLTGSGFVVGADLVITNAHVVAGVEKPTVRVKGKGKAFEGTIVYFDPALDVALIRTKDFPSVALQISDPLKRGDDTVIAGFPGGGPLILIPGRVRSVSESKGIDIYGKVPVTREIYSLSADIQQGDSGAPMFAIDGTVAGLVFASSATDAQTGYALTATEFMVGVESARTATKAVDTGECSGE
jgi:S1-C subfamily serine protease